MAKIIKASGATQIVEPANGSDFSLEELNVIVEGYIEIVSLDDGEIMVVNEEGKIHQLEVNVEATKYVFRQGVRDCIVGNVLICKQSEVK